MTEDKEVRLRAARVRRMVLCAEHATKVLDATVLEHLCLLMQLRVALWRLRWSFRAASLRRLGADACGVDPVEYKEVRAVET